MATVTGIAAGGRDGRPGWWIDTAYPGSVAARLRAAGAGDDDLFVAPGGKRLWVARERQEAILTVAPGASAHFTAPSLFSCLSGREGRYWTRPPKRRTQRAS